MIIGRYTTCGAMSYIQLEVNIRFQKPVKGYTFTLKNKRESFGDGQLSAKFT